MMRLSSSKPGFTLAELLIVLAVLGVLTATLYPVICYARPAARKTACMSNLKQLSGAVVMYTSDYDGRYPRAGIRCSNPAQPDGTPDCPAGALIRESYDDQGRSHENRFGYGETWQGGGLKVMGPYIKDERILWCPATWKQTVPRTPTDPKGYYAGFEWLERPARVRYPAAKVLMLEAYAYHEQRDSRHEVDHPKRHDEPSNPKRRVNVLFVDGHVKNVDLSTGCSGNPDPRCVGWESCQGPGGNGNYVCSGFGKGIHVPDFP